VTNPFQAALGGSLDAASPSVREHFARPAGTYAYRGVMRRVWRRGGWRGRLGSPALWLARFANTLFRNTGTDVPFELVHEVVPEADGSCSIRFRRTFHFPGVVRRFDAHLTYDPARAAIVDRLGRGGLLEVELHPWVDADAGALCLRSGRQWLRAARYLRVRLPGWLAGAARVREWQEPGGRLGISVVIHNPLLGDFFGYEGTLAPARAPEQSRPLFATTKEVGA
jgi:hypothetical protein